VTDSNYTALLIVLDRSGSMSSIRNDMVGGLDELLRTHAKEPGLLTVDVVTFDDRIEVTHHFAQPNDVHIELVPRGSTALHDAMGFAINGFGAALAGLPEHARPGNVQVIIVTDGEENASREYTADTVRELVKQQTEQYKWDFLFLGADQDAVLTASQLGIDADKALTFARGTENLHAMTGALTEKLSAVRAGSRDHKFTDEERLAATRNDDSSESSPS
jgi:uncharacterized protein YegL